VLIDPIAGRIDAIGTWIDRRFLSIDAIRTVHRSRDLLDRCDRIARPIWEFPGSIEDFRRSMQPGWFIDPGIYRIDAIGS